MQAKPPKNQPKLGSELLSRFVSYLTLAWLECHFLPVSWTEHHRELPGAL